MQILMFTNVNRECEVLGSAPCLSCCDITCRRARGPWRDTEACSVVTELMRDKTRSTQKELGSFGGRGRGQTSELCSGTGTVPRGGVQMFPAPWTEHEKDVGWVWGASREFGILNPQKKFTF